MPQPSRLSAWGHGAIVAAALVGIAAVAMPRLPAADTWWHLAAGRLLVDTGGLVWEDPFSFGPGRGPWLNHEWLAEVLFYGLFRLGGLEALYLFRTLAVVVAFGVLPIWGAVRRGVPASVAAPTAFACCLGAEGWAFFDARAYLFTYLGVSGTFLAAREYLRTGSRVWLYAMPAAVAVWANCHGGFILGPLILAVGALGSVLDPSRRPRAAGLAAAALAALLVAAVATPFGLEALTFPFSLMRTSAFTLGLNEWARPDLLGAQVPYLVLVLVSAGLLAVRSRQLSWADRLWAAAFLGAGLVAWRHAPLAAIAMAHLLPEGMPRVPRLSPPATAVGGTLFLLLSLGAVAGRIQGGAQAWTLEREMFPVEAVAFLEANPDLPRELFQPYEWGGYLEWRLFPRVRTFIDGRANTVFSEERYAKALWVQYGDPWRSRLQEAGRADLLGASADWESVLDGAGIRMVLCSRLAGVGDLCDRLERSGRWFRVHDDRNAAVYLRDDPEMRAVAAGLTHPVTAWSLLARALEALGRGDEAAAVALLEESVRLDPRLPEARVYRGVLLLRAGRDGEGAEELETALRLDPSVREANFNLGLRALRAGDRAAGIRHLERELEIDPKHPQAGNLLRDARAGGGGG